MSRSFDIVIGGGGMVGTSLALALEPLGLKVAVVEPVQVTDDEQPSFDERSTALSRSTQRMFSAMALWDDVAAASTAIRRIHVSDKGRFAFSHIDAKEQGVEALGHVVINRVLGGVLRHRLRSSNATLFCPDRITAVEETDDGARLTLESGETLEAGLLVAADGARSSLREQLGIGVERKDYDQSAIIGNLLPERSAAGVAYERFTEDGPLAMLPIADDRVAFVWVTTHFHADQLIKQDDATFTRTLHESFGHRLGDFSKIGTRTRYPLTLSKAHRLRSSRSVLVGNAAHGLHPVAAQGFNLGLRDVAALCDCIKDAPGDVSEQLERYASWRRKDQGTLVSITDGLVELFRSPNPVARAGRAVGMLGFDLIPGVRQAFARQMMGLNGRLPRLSRGVPLE
ncbi:MAG: 2-octaprenyl-6-methoxyphenyl hydroxylase [Pseudomonadota bacterium]